MQILLLTSDSDTDHISNIKPILVDDADDFLSDAIVDRMLTAIDSRHGETERAKEYNLQFANDLINHDAYIIDAIAVSIGPIGTDNTFEDFMKINHVKLAVSSSAKELQGLAESKHLYLQFDYKDATYYGILHVKESFEQSLILQADGGELIIIPIVGLYDNLPSEDPIKQLVKEPHMSLGMCKRAL